MRARAIALIKELDAENAGYRAVIERELDARIAARAVQAAAGPTAVRCASCGGDNDADASFCKRCGARIGKGAGGAG